MKVEVVVLGYPSLTVHVVSRCKATLNLNYFLLPELKIKKHLCKVQILITNPNQSPSISLFSVPNFEVCLRVTMGVGTIRDV